MSCSPTSCPPRLIPNQGFQRNIEHEIELIPGPSHWHGPGTGTLCREEPDSSLNFQVSKPGEVPGSPFRTVLGTCPPLSHRSRRTSTSTLGEVRAASSKDPCHQCTLHVVKAKCRTEPSISETSVLQRSTGILKQRPCTVSALSVTARNRTEFSISDPPFKPGRDKTHPAFVLLAPDAFQGGKDYGDPTPHALPCKPCQARPSSHPPLSGIHDGPLSGHFGRYKTVAPNPSQGRYSRGRHKGNSRRSRLITREENTRSLVTVFPMVVPTDPRSPSACQTGPRARD